MSDPLSPQASEYLESIAKWFTTAKVEAVNPTMSRCIDEDRFSLLKPFLEELNLEKAGFTLWRVTGNIVIKKKPGHENLFFPLGINKNGIKVGGTTIMPYNFKQLTMDQPWSGGLDFLLVVRPEEEQKP
ncbi:hypothetical protein BJY00DRAFT_279249 [Aspergillus carlsbadensis]|nr:hypothetical protein BJY00DRAFT_279249 [Aspergillus carlsbadensis]